MKQINYLKYLLAFSMSIALSMSWAQVTTFEHTGAVQTYTVPVGVTSIEIEAFGAEGGGPFGGLGGRAIATLVVTPGDVFDVNVGGNPTVQLGPGGFNGGGAVNAVPCGGASDGWPGGGASDVRTSPDLSDRMIVAGGGGGQGYSNGVGGAGGGLSGEDGEESWVTGTYGKGGTQVAGGDGGVYGAYAGPPAPSGEFGIGGDSGPEDTYCTGGAGGGGWYGGGGGFVSAGAGGSSYVDYPGTTDEETVAGLREGHGQIIITVLCTGIEVDVTDEEICLGESFTLTGEGEGSISWDGGVENGEEFTPDVAGVVTYTATSDDDGDCGFSIDIEVFELPEVTASVDEEEICIGESIVLTGGGADEYTWFPLEIEDGEDYSPEVGEYTYTVVGTDGETGCENTAEVEVTVNDLPEVLATATDEEICLGESVTLNGDGATEYVWDPEEEDGVEFTPDATGTTTYSVEGTDDNGCSNDAEIEITVYDVLEITYSVIEEILGDDGEIDITVSGGSTPYLFDWDDDGVTGDFDDTEDLTGLAGGTYVVVVMCDAGCEVSETIELDSQVGIDELNNLNVTVYPNPATDVVTISLEGTFNYELKGINGEIISNGKGFNSEEIALDKLAKGIYMLTVFSGDQGKSVTRIIKQ
ncbi:MAG: hypothetical protein ACI8ZM_005095 [Crocinitomix sp.]|jgi:hypothetical protein